MKVWLSNLDPISEAMMILIIAAIELEMEILFVLINVEFALSL